MEEGEGRMIKKCKGCGREWGYFIEANNCIVHVDSVECPCGEWLE